MAHAASSPDKGRVLVADRDLAVGQVVLEDDAFVCASWHAELCTACREAHPTESCAAARQMFGAAAIGGISGAEAALADVEGIDELDKARLVLLCLAAPHDRLVASLKDLARSNMDRWVVTAQAVLQLGLPQVAALLGQRDAAFLAQLIAALNTNCHTLEELGGSGLFLKACVAEHSCAATCSFTTEGTHLWLVPIEPLAAGARLSIDYLNNYYEPAAERRAALQYSYGFVCDCAKCTGELPDRVRAFRCPSGEAHVVCAFGDGDETAFRCLEAGCGFAADAAQAAAYTAAEVTVATGGASDLLRPEHYLHFDTLSERAHEVAAAPALNAEDVQLWKRLVGCLDQVLPKFHHERVIHYDKFAQVLFKAGDKQASLQAFQHALEISRVSAGPQAKLTRQLQSMVDKMPADLPELVARYGV